MPRDVSAVGPLNIDLLITGDGPPDWESLTTWDGPSDMEMTVAGSVGYTVRNLARLGLSVSVSSCLPNDALTAFIKTGLDNAGVETQFIRHIPGSVGGIGVYMLLFGSRKRPLTYRLPTHPLWPLAFTDDEVENLLDARLLHCGGYLHFKQAWGGALVELYRAARTRGLITTMDPQFPLFAMQPPWISALDDILPYVDILFCDDGEARNITGEATIDAAAKVLLDSGPAVVAIKQSDKGSSIYTPDKHFCQPAIILGELVDSIGAGDAYDAGFIYGTLRDWPLEQRALFASIAAGFTVTGVGGSQTLPAAERIMAEMQARS